MILYIRFENISRLYFVLLFSFNFIPFAFLMFYLEKVLFVVFGANK